MRAIARGSDGLAEICEDDAKEVIIPSLNAKQREEVKPFIQSILTGRTSLNVVVKQMIKEKELDYNEPEKRPSHINLV